MFVDYSTGARGVIARRLLVEVKAGFQDHGYHLDWDRIEAELKAGRAVELPLGIVITESFK